MKVDHVLLLAAGKGTRMGAIGKSLPKVQWPIFEKSLLELEVSYVRELVNNPDIYINLYHEKAKIHDFIKSHETFKSVNIIEEQDVLYIGGAIHNLAEKLDYKGNLLVINSDQFLYFDREIFEKGLNFLAEYDGVLFSYEVNSNDLYGALEIEDGLFKSVIPNERVLRNTKMKTYTGMSFWNLEKMDRSPGASHFFQTVADGSKKIIKVLDIKDFEYWDFGTLKRYYESMFKVLDRKDCAFKEFLIRSGAIDPRKLTNKGYNSKTGINLTDRYIENCYSSINLGQPDREVNASEKAIIGPDYVENLDLV